MKKSGDPACDSPACSCKPELSRRSFVELLGWGTAAALAGGTVMAGPFDAADAGKFIPADKKLDGKWVASLTARGEREVHRGAELDKIGMPIGGICAGQLYLGGDGRLWHWDIFNQSIYTGDQGYAYPPTPDRPVEQGFAVRITNDGKSQVRKLDRSGFADVTFCGEYPIGYVEYRDPGSPVAVSLEAFSPFIPLNADDSSLPATVLRLTVSNSSDKQVEVELGGWLENAVGLHSAIVGAARRNNGVDRKKGLLRIDYSAEESQENKPRPEVVFDDFQRETYEGWEVTGTAFGKGPILRSDVPQYQGDLGGPGKRVVNSHASAPGKTVEERDRQTGTLTSRPFTIERNFVSFWIGGGAHRGKTCLNLLVDGRAVLSATGHNSNQMGLEAFDVRPWQGKQARLEIVDTSTGAWGNIGIGEIKFTDVPQLRFSEAPDFGTMSLALLQATDADLALPKVKSEQLPDSLFPPAGAEHPDLSSMTVVGIPLIGGLIRQMSIEPHGKATATFVITWHFPNLRLKNGGRHYAARFASAGAVAEYVAEHFARLHEQTRLRHDTWYDSTLPFWFLNRSMLNTSILATSTCHWFADGRFYAWEGVGCCDGTCTHVWHYAHAVARLFPQLERDLRRRTDFGTAIDLKTGIIQFRGDHDGLAIDGQAGCILRAYREHQMSADATLLTALWPRIKLAMQCLVERDEGDGLLKGPQHNTLDQPWFGKVAWLSSLYVAAARACEEMAYELGNYAYARKMRGIVERGSRSLDSQLFNGEYYVQLADPQHAKSVGSFDGCEIDQVFGQSWCWQVGLGRILSAENTKRALQSLWKYNFAPDVGPFRAAHKPGRWYAMAGEAGLIMCTWPKGEGARVSEGYDYYFNECMTGFEYQAAGHMLWEGMVTEGLAICRSIHDRYNPLRRNPWNEVECGDHYSRAMASYGVFLAACGFEYHGPQGHLGFAPRLTPDNFRAAFTSAEGWGTIEQTRDAGGQTNRIEMKQGRLRLRSLAFELAAGAKPASVTVSAGGKRLDFGQSLKDGRLSIALAKDVLMEEGQTLEVRAV